MVSPTQCDSDSFQSSSTMTMTMPNEAQHTLPTSETDEAYSITIDLCGDQSTVSSISCSVKSNRMKRTRKTMDFTTVHQCEQDDNKKRRRRGTSYTIVEIHSMLHLMKRVLPKCADEWELICMVHGRIFPDNDRTVTSLKKKFRDLCRETGADEQQLDERFRVKPVHGEREVAKAREVQRMISQKPSGYQLVLQKAPNGDVMESGNYPGSFPNFKVKVPNPLQPSSTDSAPIASVPQFIEIPQTPEVSCEENEQPVDSDDMSELDLDDYQDDMNMKDSEHIIGRPMSQISPNVEGGRSLRITPYCESVTYKRNIPAIIF
mmetsp:Transcript_21047/g.26582  ORF Transcript_21047/g.26582 Transcript_21047/m.26582 type:complete len:319 (-) Transcript_21047:12-968(-)